MTARDLQRKDGQWTRAKSFDTFAPFGPWIAKIDPFDADIETRVNGKVMQFISGVMTLEPDDVIATGTSPRSGASEKGRCGGSSDRGDWGSEEFCGVARLGREPLIGFNFVMWKSQ
ncbi:MAG: fumarylacetoacetate hydrolase family protein [Methanothrix sp.]|nr:fumarylacetoacetate hydrolase family protein [Methanothrix sp.]